MVVDLMGKSNPRNLEGGVSGFDSSSRRFWLPRHLGHPGQLIRRRPRCNIVSICSMEKNAIPDHPVVQTAKNRFKLLDKGAVDEESRKDNHVCPVIKQAEIGRRAAREADRLGRRGSSLCYTPRRRVCKFKKPASGDIYP